MDLKHIFLATIEADAVDDDDDPLQMYLIGDKDTSRSYLIVARAAFKLVLLVQPGPAATERVILLLQNSFNQILSSSPACMKTIYEPQLYCTSESYLIFNGSIWE